MEASKIYNVIKENFELNGFVVSEERIEELTDEFQDECESEEINDDEQEDQLKIFMTSVIDEM